MLPGWPERSRGTGGLRDSRVTDAVVEKPETITGDAVDIPGWLRERVGTANSHHDGQGGPQEAYVNRDTTGTFTTTTHFVRSIHLDVSRPSFRSSAAAAALRRAVARHCGQQQGAP